MCGRDVSCKYTQITRLWSTNGVCPTITANSTQDICKMIIYENNYFYIKTISPLESWRLMGFKESDFYKILSIGTSKRQIFKQVGNSIAFNVIYNILKRLF